MAKYTYQRILICLLSLICVSFSFSQSITFNKGILFQDYELQESITQVLEVDDGYIICGYSDFWRTKLVISKLDFMGDIQWLKKYGYGRYFYMPGSSDAMIKTSDSNFALAINLTDTTLLYNQIRMMIMKFDKKGDTLWSHQLYSPDSADWYCQAEGIIETYDKGFLVYGNEEYKIGVLIKTDSLGRREWIKYYGNAQSPESWEIYSVRQTSDSGFIAGGYQKKYNDKKSGDPKVAKFNKNGTIMWDKSFGSLFEDYNGAYIQPLSDSNFIVLTHYTTETSGYPHWFPQKNRLQIIEISENGDVLLNLLKGDVEDHPWISDLEVMEDGSFIACGGDIYGSTSWMYNFALEKDSLFFRIINPTIRIDTFRLISDIKNTSDGGIIACGDYDTPIDQNYIRHPWIIKTDRYGCFEQGCDPNGIYAINQPLPTIACKNQQTELSIETYNSSGNVNYTWQSFQNETWEDIDDPSIYQGFHNDTLIINPFDIDVQKESYRCNYFNEMWNFFSDSVTVDFLDTLNITSQPESQSVQYGGPASFMTQANGEYPIDYQWYHNSLPLEGSNDSILLIDNVYENDTGTYYCALTNACGRFETDTVFLRINDLGIDEQHNSPLINISPNPTRKFLLISSAEKIYIEIVILTDLAGKSLSEKHFGMKDRLNYTMDVYDLPAGIYILIVQTDQERITQKILKL
jgi:hypothetical protein